MGRCDGRVAFITGAGRGQGRSHAVRLAEEGADIIAVDICHDIDSVNYELASPEDLAETERLVKETGQRIVSRQADVRDLSELRRALEDGLQEFGKLDVVVANAGIFPTAMDDPQPNDFTDAVNVDLVGVLNTVGLAIPHLREYGSIIMTGSTAAMIPNTTDNPKMGPGAAGYGWAKRVLIEYTTELALQLAPWMIRVNCVHPTNCNTRLLHNDDMYAGFRPDLENPTREDAEPAFVTFQAMPIPWVEPHDISAIVVMLASNESRFVTGQQIRVDGGAILKQTAGEATANIGH
ncbi:mycofactocin-coupled SDR family oxidoreductase [Mycobacterium sp. 94-17]|uniref:mycofactocin-coupled SDR family oxidoreductase n=1 Tax=Mycobacterium sp. 94-17 TaxID=2986147 RepID=UPI002D1ED6EE|nr:mycofactocin-coupled SDR family oxidoreductase [Mycobacterium sp. 94-17]MEB4209763.1 mycofactocin-coupled SDR family oxidoreductase [Mycobacterium sp. 94-17]